MRALWVALLACAGSSAAHSADTTYYGYQSFGSATASYSITTDGALGVLLSTDILAFDFKLSDQAGSATITNSNGFIGYNSAQPGYYPQDLSATRTELDFSYADYPVGGDNLGFFDSTTGAYFCFQANACYQFDYGGIGESSVGGVPQNQTSSPPSTIATVSFAMPEPEAWIEILFGFAFLGAAVRGRLVLKGRHLLPDVYRVITK